VSYRRRKSCGRGKMVFQIFYAPMALSSAQPFACNDDSPYSLHAGRFVVSFTEMID
jgi:hypothetical protein